MPDLEITAILEWLIQAFPEKRLAKNSYLVYLDELSDIPVMLLERAARQIIRNSTYFPRISELRQAADQIAGKTFNSPASSLGASYLNLEAQLLETDYFHQGEFNIKKWEKLADQLEQANRPHRAAEVREKARHILESEAAYQRGEDYPSVEARQHYANWDSTP